MRSSSTASKLLPAVFWSMFLLFVFAAPMLMAARDGGGDTVVDAADWHTEDLIRQHREAVSPFFSVPEMQTPPTRADKQLRNGEMTEEWSFVGESRPQSEPMIRPQGNRAKRIRA